MKISNKFKMDNKLNYKPRMSHNNNKLLKIEIL